nr:MAG TPA: hypothetical protein [Bacteriophage sp.]
MNIKCTWFVFDNHFMFITDRHYYFSSSKIIYVSVFKKHT